MSSRKVFVVALAASVVCVACSSAPDGSTPEKVGSSAEEQGLLDGPTQYRTCNVPGYALHVWAAGPNDPYTPQPLLDVWGTSATPHCVDIFYAEQGLAERQLYRQCLTPIPNTNHSEWQTALGWLTTSNPNVAGATMRLAVEGGDSCTTQPFDGPQGTPFVKHGNNGTVDCNTFCGGAQWGQAGQCLGSAIDALPCNQSTGLVQGVQQTCTCAADGQTFVKGGDNGTASCDAFCGGAQWGRTGTCVASQLSTNATATVDGAKVAYDADCTVHPGLIGNGTEMTCVCQR